MYNSKLAIAIKHNGKILRETKDLVKLPYGSEFSVLIKNLNSRRAKFTLEIDGTNVLDDQEIIVNANSEVEMKRFIRNGNMTDGNAFKFIERTSAIEDGPRGIKIDDGIVRVEFWFEQEHVEKVAYDSYWAEYNRRNSQCVTPMHNTTYSSSLYSTSIVGSTLRGASASGSSSTAPNLNVGDVGITVPGSNITQKFTSVYGFMPETNSHIIILRISGITGEINVTKPVTVQSRPTCSTCSKINKATSKFCASCGTSLILL